jgi:hypothetical protein
MEDVTLDVEILSISETTPEVRNNTASNFF